MPRALTIATFPVKRSIDLMLGCQWSAVGLLYLVLCAGALTWIRGTSR